MATFFFVIIKQTILCKSKIIISYYKIKGITF